MKLRLPSKLVAAIMAAASSATFATLATGSTAYGETTYTDLTKSDYFEANANVYNTGKGTFFLETETCELNLTLTLNLNAFAAYQGVHDYANAGYYSPFVTWTYNNNSNSTYGMADVSSGYSSADYSGITGMWNGSPWTTNTKVTTETLRDYADADGNVTLTINNNPAASSNHVYVTTQNSAGEAVTLYSATGLRSNNYTSQHITSFTVNMNYVTSVTLNSNSILDSSNFTAPKDYTEAFVKTQEESVGRIVFLGDSITHGVNDMTWRWGLFKTMVDNGIEYEIAGPLSGYHSDPLNGDYNGNYSSSQYGGATFDNAHYAQSSGRTHNMLTASNSGNSLGNSTGVNYGGVTSAKVGNEYNGDTYVMMMGTNDILSDGANTTEKMDMVTNRLLGQGSLANGTWTNAGVEGPLVGLTNDNAAYRGEWGTMGKIIDNMKMGEGDTMYVMPVPTWGVGRTGLHVYADLVPAYNEKLEAWTKAYSDSHTGTVKYVDINRGLVDKTLNGRYLAPDAFFRTTGGDYIHPNEQGALIIAGNLAQGMGLAGRTAGLARSAADAQGWNALAPTINIADGETQHLLNNVFTEADGYTIDFGAVFGNGAASGWLDKSNALSVSVGDGTNTGTLNISEGYISWGDKLLFCQDNSVSNNDKIRVAFHNGNVAENVASGYYVWLGDMLIGQGLGNQTGTLVNGVSVSAKGAAATLSGFSYTNTAYAPTTTYTTATPYLVQQAQGNTDMVIAEIPLPSMESHDSGASSHLTDVNFGEGTVTNNEQFATTGQTASGTLKVTRTGTVSTNAWLGAVGTGHTGDVLVNYNNLTSTTASVLTVLNASVTEGDVAVVLDGGTDIRVKNAFGNGDRSFHGVYNGSVGGAMRLEINEATLAGGILMGNTNGTGTISGGTEVIVNAGASIGGDIFAGSGSGGTINGGTAITITGGDISGGVYGGNYNAGTINGGTAITITGGHITGEVNGGNRKEATGSVNGGTTVTVQGNKASIGGNITADTVKLQNVEASGYSDGFDRYAGTITATNLVLDNYTAGLMKATLVTDYVTVSNGTNATIRNLTLRNCSIDADEASTLTLGGEIHSGNTISYTGNLYLEDGTTFNFSNTDSFTAAEGAEGISAGQYIYKVKADSEGHLYSADGSALTTAHTSTFTGAGVVEGKSFFYESATGALIAYGSDATYNITTSTVNYSDIDGVGGVTMSGGQLNLDKALNAGVTITATGGTVNVGEGVQFNTSALSGSTNPAIVNNGGTVTLTDATQAATLLKTITGDSGTIKLADGLTVTVPGTANLHSQFQGVLDIGKASLYLGGGTVNDYGGDGGNEPNFDSFSSIHINGGTLRLTGWGCGSHQSQLVVDGDSTLKVQQNDKNGNYGFNIDGVQLTGGDLTVISGDHRGRVAFTELSGSHTLFANGSTESNVELAVKVNDMSAFTGNVVAAPTRDGSNVTLELYTGNGDVEMGNISASNHSTINLFSSGGHSFTVDDITVSGANAAVNVGSASIATHVTMNGALAGTVNVLANSTLKLGDTFSAESATINGAGYVDVHMKDTDEKHYSLGENGYLSATIDLTDYQNKVTFNNGGWKVDGAANSGATFDSSTYKLSVAENNVFYVNTMVAATDVTAPTGGGNAVLAGSGTLTTTSWTLSGISVADSAWTGTVSVTNSSKQGNMHTSIANLANANSKVELKGVNGWFGGDVERNIVLTGTEANGTGTALTINDGHSNTYTRTFTRSVEGHGDILFNWNNGYAHTVAFSGDISGWDGSFKTTGTGDGRGDGIGIGLKFADDASVINAGVTHDRTRRLTVTFATTDAATVNGVISKGSNGGELKLVAENDVTFNNTVTIDSLTATGHTVTIGSHGEGDSATHGNLTLGAVSTIDTLVINDGGTANATVHSSGTGFMKGTVNVNAGGTFNIVGDDRLGWGNNGTAAINMEGEAGKLATMTVSDKQTFSSTLNLNGYTNVINGEGDSNNKGLEIFQSDGHIGTINATGTNNTIATGIFLRNLTTITTAEGAELTISGVVRNGVSDGAAEMVKAGAGTLTLSGNNSFSGNLTVNAGTIVMGTPNALGADNGTSDRLITINRGGTIDINGKSDGTAYTYTLAGGSLVNNGSATGEGHIQTVGLKLTDDSSIGGTGDFYLISRSWGATSVALNAHTLTKTGSNTVNFWSTAVGSSTDNAGILRVEDGVLNIDRRDNNKTLSSVYADIEVAKSSGNAVSGNFLLASGHTISSTEVGGSVNAAIQLGGATKLHTDGVNSLTLNGVLSNGTGATGSVTKTGMGTVILNAANTYTGTTTVDAGALVASNSNALSNSVLSFSDKTAEESPYRIFAFATDLRFNNTTHALEDAGTQIDGTIKGLDGHRGYVVAKTLTIDVDGDETHAFMHRYDVNNETTDRVEMKVDKIVKTGTGTQIIGGDYSEARGFTTNGLVINNGVEVQQGTLHMMTRGIVTTDFNVLAGATLKTTDDNVHALYATSAVQYNGMVTLHGTEDSAAVLDYTNGSTNIANGLYVDGYGKVINRYDKFQYINGLYNAEGTTTNDITFTRTDTPSNTDDSNAAAIVLTGSGNFAGTVHLSSESVLNDGSAVNEAYGIQMLGEAAKTALANAVVSFEGDNVTVLSFLNADRPLSVAYWDDLAEAYATPMDGTVGGLQGTNGAVYAATLTINAADGADYTYGGALNVTGLTKTGTGTQTLNGDLSAFNADLTVNAGTLVITGTTLPQTGSADEGQRGTLNLNGGTLKIGNGDGNETSLSSFSAVNFAGGVLHYNNKKDTLHNVTVAADTSSRIYSYDMGNVNDGSKLLLAGDTALNGNLTLSNYWNAAFEVEHLTGAGTLAVTGADDSGNTSAATAQDGTYTINSLVGFTGNLSFSSTGARATINTNGSTDRMGTLTVENRSEVTVNSGESTFEATTLAISGNPSYAATVVTFNGAGANFSGNIATTGNGTINVNGTAPITANTISLTAGTTLNFAQKVTLSSNSRPEMLYTTDDQVATYINFNGGYAYSGTAGYALLAGKNVHITMGGTSDLGSKSIGFTEGASLTLKENASLSVGQIYNSRDLYNNGTVNVGTGASLTVANSNSDSSIANLNLANSSTTKFAGTTTIEHLTVEGTSVDLANTVTVKTLNIQKLLGGSDTTLNIYSEQNDSRVFTVNMGDASKTYTDDDLFSGTLWLTTHADQGSTAHRAVNLAIKAEDVLKNATVKLDNWMRKYNNTRVIMSLESDAKVAGINSANTGDYAGAGSYIRSGAMTVSSPDGAADMASTGDTAHTLEITGSGEYTTNAYVMGNVNLAMTGSGTQKFSGNVNNFDGTIEVNNGTLAFTGLSAKDATENINNLHVSTATVNNDGSLKAGRATLTAKEAPMARTVSKTGTVENAEFTNDSLAGTGTNGGSITNGLLAIQEAASYTISDMTLTNSEISAAETHLEMSNINVDATSNVVALNGSTLAGSNRLTLSDTQDVHPNTPLQSNQLSGLTLQNNATLAITLNNEIGADLTNGAGFTVTLSNFQWKDLLNNDGDYVGALEDVIKLNQVFTVTATVDGTLVRMDVIRAAQGGVGNADLILNVVPEPSTSILSLLALAGVAARRRRK